MENTDNSVPNTQAQPAQPVQPIQPQQASVETAPDPAQIPPKKSNKMLFVLILVALVLIVCAGVAYMMMGAANNTQELPAPTLEPTQAPSPTPEAMTEETEAESITIDDPATDFVEVDQSLQSL